MKAIAVIALMLAACSQQAGNPGNNAAQPVDQAGANVAGPADEPVDINTEPVPIPGNDNSALSAPPPLPGRTPDAESSSEAAAKVLDAYFAALATKRYADAYRMWGNRGQASGMSLKQFADSFARYSVYDGNIGKPGPIEGAAGSAYIEFPVKVTGALTKGGGFVLEGPMTLRRINDVDGSTAEQRRWHIESSGLKPRP